MPPFLDIACKVITLPKEPYDRNTKIAVCLSSYDQEHNYVGIY